MNLKRFELTYFHGPYGKAATAAVYHDIALSGMTLCQLHGSVEQNRQILTWCENEGLRANVCDTRLSAAIHASEEDCDALVKAVVDDFIAFPALNGFDIVDEPNEQAFEGIGRVIAALGKYAPGVERVVNLFPNYATPEQLGSPDYDAHLDAFVKKANPDFLSYDHYHFMGRGAAEPPLVLTGDRREDLIRQSAYLTHDRPGFFANIASVYRCAKENDLDAMAIVLLTEHGPYRNLTRAELSWEAGMCLAYGFKRVSYFTYYQPAPIDADAWRWDNAMVDYDGNRMEHWYDLQALAPKIKSIGRYLFPLACDKVVHTEKEEQIDCGRIGAVHGNTVCGCFENGAVLVVNKNHKYQTEIAIEAPALERFDPESGRFVPSEKTFVLEAGEFVVIR